MKRNRKQNTKALAEIGAALAKRMAAKLGEMPTPQWTAEDEAAIDALLQRWSLDEAEIEALLPPWSVVEAEIDALLQRSAE